MTDLDRAIAVSTLRWWRELAELNPQDLVPRIDAMLKQAPPAAADADEDAYVIERMGKLLAEIAIIVNGPEPNDTRWSYHDLPEKVRALKQAPPAAAALEGWSGWAIQYPGKLPKLYGAEEIARMNWSPDAGADLVRLVEVDRVKASDWAAMLAAAERKGVES